MEQGAKGNAGGVSITTGSLKVTNGAQLGAGTFGQGDAGFITINANNSVIFDGEGIDGINSGAFTSVLMEAEGDAGGVFITTVSLEVLNGARLSASIFGKGNAGSVTINANNSVIFDGEGIDGINSGAFSAIDSEAEGNAGGIFITTASLEVLNGARLSTNTFGKGNAGGITIDAPNSVIFDGKGIDGESSGAFSSIQESAIGNAGGLNITTNSLSVTNGAVLFTGTLGQGEGGKLKVDANFFKLDHDALISSLSTTAFNAGDITLNITDFLQAINSQISTSSIQSAGGNLTITAGEIELRDNSNIFTNVFSGADNGGNITLEADSIIAFDDSDIFAFAADGQGGNITLNTPAFFANNFNPNSFTADPNSLDGNSRADINATGAVSGAVNIPDVSFIQNSLTELPDNAINTDNLVANSCVVPSQEQNGTFIITGGGGLPTRPEDNFISPYPTGEVQTVEENTSYTWNEGDPIVEPQGVYRLTNGKGCGSFEATSVFLSLKPNFGG